MNARSRILTAVIVCLWLALPAHAQSPAPVAQVPETCLFQIVLLIGEKSPSNQPSDVPENAAQALDDISRFLPYKSYRLVDVALIRSAGSGETMIAGPEGHDYAVQLSYTTNSESDKIFVRNFELNDRGPGPHRGLISTTFSVDWGETIVVGSSKLDGGDQALIVLFTALPK